MWQIISAYIIGLITITGVLIFSKIVLNKKVEESKKKILLTMLLAASLNTIVYLYFNATIKTLLIAIIDIFFNKYIFKISTNKSIFLTFIYIVLLIVPELIQLSFVKLINMNIEYCYNTYAGSIISNIINYILFIIITYCIRKLLRKLINTEIDNNLKIIIYSSLTFVCIGMFFYTLIKEFRFGENIIIYILAIIVLLSVLFSLIKQIINNRIITNKYDKLLEYMTSYEKEIEKIRILRHETRNEFLTIKSKIIDKQKNKEIIEYINTILKEDYEIKNEMYAKFGYLPANGIKGLCYFKTQEAESKGLKTSINVSPRVEKSFLYKLNNKENSDLGKILGVLLDNAIEGGIESKEKQFGIEAYFTLKNECEFIICNSNNSGTNITKSGKERFSTKGKNRGHGLILVNYLIKHNKIFSLETKITNGLYIQTLKIKKSTNK